MHEQLSSPNPLSSQSGWLSERRAGPLHPFCWSCAAFHKRSQYFDISFYPKVITKVPRTQNRHIQIQHPHSVSLGGQHSENKVCVCVCVSVCGLLSLACTALRQPFPRGSKKARNKERRRDDGGGTLRLWLKRMEEEKRYMGWRGDVIEWHRHTLN